MKKLVVIALLLSLVAGFATYRFMQELQKSDAPPTIKAVAANGQIATYTKITAEMLKTVDVPAEFAHPLTVTDTESIVGKVALSNLEDGEVILSTKIVELGKSGASLSYELQSGYRAMTFTADEVSGIAGYIAPGDSLDIIALLEKQQDDGTVKNYASMVAENVEVIKTGVKGSTEGGYSSITLSVPAEDALRYYFILSKGSYRFILRSTADDEIIDPADYTMD